MFVVLEGIDGSGKETIARFLAARLGWSLLFYPNKERMMQIRQYLQKQLEIPGKSLVLLFLADILWDEEKWAKTVLCRSAISTVAYAAPSVEASLVKNIVRELGVKPADLVIYLDVPPNVAVERAKGKGERYDDDIKLLTKVRERYEELMEECFLAKRWVRINAALPLEEVKAKAWQAVEHVIG